MRAQAKQVEEWSSSSPLPSSRPPLAQPVSLSALTQADTFFSTLTNTSALPLPQSYIRLDTMVQGKTKGMQSKGPGRVNSKDPKKGKRVIPPKKAAAVKHASLQRTLSAKINNSIERQMVNAASPGKLTIMKSIAFRVDIQFVQ
ncbi:hypothetical protein CTheo_20 [Ceratobasidium theobromae]|uniref:Uncharacterized protein n=1 Tax=Ceratobasidium theobromae TaxID=1582974 RepID=A0A5N5QXS8_9AGAM|nr:hypothetical protein CTheo_20 [Ceratobasidium theobromae]